MGKIRKSILRRKAPTIQPRHKQDEEWDVHEEGFHRDEIDDWQEMRGRLLLDTAEPASFSEDDSEEEVLRLDLSESDGERESGDAAEDDDDEMEEDAEGPSDKAWGHRKNDFYSTDYDEGGYSSDVSEAEEEEKEALSLQRRMTEGLSAEDFALDYLSTVMPVPVGGDEGAEPQKVPEISTMSEQERLVHIQEQWPEFLELYQDLKEKAEYIDEIIEPLKKMAGCGILSQDGLQCVSILSTLYSLFCLNAMFYLTLRASGVPVENHPVVARIVQLRELLGTVRNLVNEDDIADAITAAIELSKKPSPVDNCKDLKRKNQKETSRQRKTKKRKLEAKEASKVDDEEDPLEYYNRIKRETKQRKETKQRRVTFKEDTKEGEVQEGEDGRGKRPITYQISKNKGLTPKRKKEQRNPRVKHRNKYVKALSKHRHAVRPVEKEMSRYGGELSGIKSRLSRSVRIK